MPASPSAGPASATPRPSPTLPPGIIEVINVPFTASGIVADGDVIWAEDHASTNRVYAIHPETGAVATEIAVDRPCDVAAGFGRIWIADLAAGKILVVDPTTSSVIHEVSGLAGPCGVQAVAGAVWFVVDGGLGRLDPDSLDVTVTKLSDGAFPGSGTPLWGALYQSGDLVRIDAESGKVTKTVPHPGGANEGPAVAAGHDSLWVGDSRGKLFRLDPQTAAPQDVIDTAPPSRLLMTNDSVWLTSYETGRVERIDPTTNTIVYSVYLGGNPNGITAGFGSVWVSTTGSGRLYRLDPSATGVTP